MAPIAAPIIMDRITGSGPEESPAEVFTPPLPPLTPTEEPPRDPVPEVAHPPISSQRT